MDQKQYIIEIIRKHRYFLVFLVINIQKKKSRLICIIFFYSQYSNDTIISMAVEHLQNLTNLLENTIISFNSSNTNNKKIDNELSNHIEAINICDTIPVSKILGRIR